jgi:small subunit ribosomal protein S14
MPAHYSKIWHAVREGEQVMAKKSIIARDLKRQKMIKQYAAKRAELKELGDLEGLAKLPRNSSPTRWKNRCVETGRPHATCASSAFRISFREHASKGEIPGVTKASW